MFKLWIMCRDYRFQVKIYVIFHSILDKNTVIYFSGKTQCSKHIPNRKIEDKQKDTLFY